MNTCPKSLLSQLGDDQWDARPASVEQMRIFIVGHYPPTPARINIGCFQGRGRRGRPRRSGSRPALSPNTYNRRAGSGAPRAGLSDSIHASGNPDVPNMEHKVGCLESGRGRKPIMPRCRDGKHLSAHLRNQCRIQCSASASRSEPRHRR